MMDLCVDDTLIPDHRDTEKLTKFLAQQGQAHEQGAQGVTVEIHWHRAEKPVREQRET